MVQRVISRRTARNVLTYNRIGDCAPFVCAAGDSFVLLKDIPFDELIRLVNEYADAHDRALTDFLMRPSKTIWTGSGASKIKRTLKIQNQESPEVLAIKTIGAGKKVNQVAGRYCSMAALNDAIEKLGLWGSLANHPITPAWNIVYAPPDIQRRVCEEIVRGNIRSMSWTVNSSDLRNLATSNIFELLDGCRSSETFLKRVCTPLIEWFNDPVRKGYSGANSRFVQRPLVLGWFAMWLVSKGYLLFPRNVGNGRGAELLPLKYREFYSSLLRTASSVSAADEYYRKLEPLFGKNTTIREQGRLLLATVNLACPGFETGSISPEQIAMLRDSLSLDDERNYILTSMWKLEVLQLKAAGYSPTELYSKNLIVDRRVRPSVKAEPVLWAWADNPNAKFISKSDSAKRNPDPGPNLKSQVANWRLIFPGVAGKSANKISSLISRWLYFISTLKDDDVPPRITDITPNILQSVSASKGKRTFRQFVVDHKVSADAQAAAFRVLKKAWKVACIEDGIDGLVCPVSDQLVSIKGKRNGGRPTSTTRHAVDMEVLELLVAENQANDFEFSRSREHRGRLLDSRRVIDRETGQSCQVWWPGLAVLMDLLLQIPIRHKQGRFLDSGEGDEFTVDISSLEITKNELSTATRGRAEGFIQRISLSPVREEAGLGMRITTNKTGRDYVFPWLRAEIAANVQRVIDWQKRFNPIARPVSDRGNSTSEQAAMADPVWVYPMFRDPDRQEFQPVSQQIVLEYFRALMRHVEKKYNLINNTNVRFFRKDGSPVYDIHSLRVTGVTRLLNLGVDPKIVRLLVGHSALAMTWYYEDITNRRVSTAMEMALQATTPTREALLDMGVAEREEFFAGMFNRIGVDAPPGISLLRTLVSERSPLIELRIDGICPGTLCSDGGVWRGSACSLCPYFITGPAFLAGLVLKLNNLMAEVIIHQKRVEELRQRLYECRQKGLPVRALAAEIRSEEELVDNIVTEWEAQLRYVKEAEARLDGWLQRVATEDAGNIEGKQLALISQKPGTLGVALQEVHHLELYTGLIEGAKNIEGFVPTIGVREARDEMLLEIARHAKKEELFYRLDPSRRKLILDEFAVVVLSNSSAFDDLEELFDGSATSAKYSNATGWLESLDSKELSLALL